MMRGQPDLYPRSLSPDARETLTFRSLTFGPQRLLLPLCAKCVLSFGSWPPDGTASMGLAVALSHHKSYFFMALAAGRLARPVRSQSHEAGASSLAHCWRETPGPEKAHRQYLVAVPFSLGKAWGHSEDLQRPPSHPLPALKDVRSSPRLSSLAPPTPPGPTLCGQWLH